MAKRKTTKASADYQIVLCPPDYPETCRPFCCRHEPQFIMAADVRVSPAKRGVLEIDHSVCLACGRSMGSTYGGNVLVDLQKLWERYGWHAKIGSRVIHLRTKWARIATYLFDENGWNGRHEKIARLIDPNLTMKLRVEKIPHPAAIANKHRIGHVSFDQSYLRPAA